MPNVPPPSDPAELTAWSAQLHQLAQALPYPPTPNLTQRVAPPRYRVTKPWMGWVALGMAVVLLLWAASPVSAGLWEWLQIGVVRILRVPATATLPPTTPTSRPRVTATVTLTPTITPTVWPPLATPLPRFADWGGYTTLTQAQHQMSFHILQPTYPNALGEPDYVFAQDYPGEMVILVWLDPQALNQVQMSFHTLRGEFWIEKALGEDDTLIYTKVAGVKAVWTDGTYPMRLKSGIYENVRLVMGHVLIWAKDDFTYRLETTLPLTEALRIAESLR